MEDAATPSQKAEMALRAALNELEIQREAEAKQQSMVADVELAATLHKDLKDELEQTELRHRLVSSERALAEERAVQQEERKQKTALGDVLVEELWSLSMELGDLRRWKDQHMEIVDHHNELVGKLLQAQDQIEMLRSNPPPPAAASRDESSVEQAPPGQDESKPPAAAESKSMEQDEPSTSSETKVDHDETELEVTEEKAQTTEEVLDETTQVESRAEEPLTEHAEEEETEESREQAAEDTVDEIQQSEEAPPIAETPATESPDEAEGKEQQSADADKVREINESEAKESAESEQLADTPEVSAATVPDEIKAEEDQAVVMLMEDDEEVGLASLDERPLKNVFDYIDALDILNLAQVNVALYSRVDSLFGTGATTGFDDETAPTIPSTIETVQTASNEVPPRTGTGSVASASSATIVTLPPPAAATAASTTAAAPAAATTQPEQRRGFFGLLQNRAAAAAAGQTARARPQSKQTSSSYKPPLSQAMADSMASKLSDAELGAIISMTEKLRQKEGEAEKLSKERDELAGKLDGTEAVKQFLIQKVREVETSLEKSQADESKVTQQIASDQEVIAFLDSRVQVLESDTQKLTDEKKAVETDLAKTKSQGEQKVTVLGDMLQFEREKLTENEKEWKAQRKLLVKEVKNCRSQLMALQAERDGLQEQNERLKEALLATGAGTSSNGGTSPRFGPVRPGR